jgi:lysophospholipase L1-like esterase
VSPSSSRLRPIDLEGGIPVALNYGWLTRATSLQNRTTQQLMASTTELSTRKKLLFSLILLAIVAGTVELATRFYLRQFKGYTGGSLLQYEFDPYKNVLPTRNYVDSRGLEHNAQGFRRSSDVTREKQLGTFRIFLMGGSTAYGTGGLWPHIQKKHEILKNTETVDAYLEKQLNARFPGTRFEVINAAIPSIWTHHHLIYLNQTVLKYNPDMVVMLDGYNDFYFYGRDHDQFLSYAYKEHSHKIMGEPTLGSLAYVNFWWLGRKSAFVHVALRKARVIKQLFAGRPDREPIQVDSAVAGLRDVYPQNALKMVERIAMILQQEKVQGVFVLQPMLILERGRPGMPEIEQKMFDFNGKAYLPNYEQYMVQAVPFVRDLERTTVEKFGASFIDATPIFKQAKGQIFTDYVHLTPAGNEILATHIANHIQEQIRTALATHPTAVTMAAPGR